MNVIKAARATKTRRTAKAPSPTEDVVAQQYQRWQYPEPIPDLGAWLVDNWQWFDPSHAHRLLWPDRPYRPDLDILVAGCGTNQAAVLAYTNPDARVTAVDVSEPSLEHHRYLKRKHDLDNLDVRMLPIEELPSLSKDFDLVMSTGVLHHLADPTAGMTALAQCLRPDGVLAVMLYATYGRFGVELLQGIFRELGLQQDLASLQMVKAAIATLPRNHPVRSYMTVAPDLNTDAGVVDTFLHGRDRSYTVPQCLELVSDSGLVFQDWLLRTTYYPTGTDEFHRAIDALPDPQMWAVMERINTSNACHFFTACHPQRPPSSYRIDFSSEQAPDYIPLMRYRCGLNGTQVFRPGFQMSLEPMQLAFLQRVDTLRTIREIAEHVAGSGIVADPNTAELIDYGRNLFRRLWRQDFITVDLSRTTS
ncbi:class I SAM-dependent methyltransferase [Mycolicibacterium sp.]|uniref:class I SAM-dependent methyltransferase n=1 Tax=Mycolicibacterium sp. TaxID=2320850 RepID=UPI003D0E6115